MDILVYGTGGFAREVVWLCNDLAAGVYDDPDTGAPMLRAIGFLDDNRERHGMTIAGLPVLGGVEWVAANPGIGVAIGLGNPRARQEAAHRLRDAGAVFPTLIHPTALIGERVQLGEGVIVCAGTTITVDVEIGEFSMFNLHCTVGHDARIGAFCTLAPGCNISGYVVLEEGVELGTNVAVLPGKRIGARSIVGAGAVVTSDLPAMVTAVGVPAKVIKEHGE